MLINDKTFQLVSEGATSSRRMEVFKFAIVFLLVTSNFGFAFGDEWSYPGM